MQTKTIRAFIGIPLDTCVYSDVYSDTHTNGDIKSENKADTSANRYLDRVLRPLQPRLQAGTMRWTKPHNRHLTLAFLGQVNSDILKSLAPDLTKLLSSIPVLTVPLLNLAPFPSKRSKLVAVQVEATPELVTLYQGLLDCCAGQEIIVSDSDQHFRPHITLGRYKSGRRTEPTIADSFPIQLQGNLSIYDVAFYQSTPTLEGSEYTVLHAWRLQRNSSNIP